MESTKVLAERALAFIKREAAERGVKTPAGTSVQLKLSKQDIATLLGMSRAEATRALNALRSEGIIRLEGSTVILLRDE